MNFRLMLNVEFSKLKIFFHEGNFFFFFLKLKREEEGKTVHSTSLNEVQYGNV